MFGLQSKFLLVIPGFRREIDEICSLLGYYVTHSGSSLPTFRDNLSFDPWSWDRHFFPKRRWGITTVRRVISQSSATLNFYLFTLWVQWVPGLPWG